MRTFEHSGPPVPYWLIRIREEDLKHLTSTQKKRLLRNHEPWMEERWAKRENASAEQISKRDGFYNLYLEFIRTDDGDVQDDHASPSWPRLKKQWVLKLLVSLFGQACCPEWPSPSPTLPAPHRSLG